MKCTSIVFLFTLTVLATGQANAQQRGARGRGSQPSAVRIVASVKQIMQAMVIPTSDAVFKAAGDAPKDDKGWADLENSAVTLTESGNLLMIGSRVRDSGDWMKMSPAMVDAAATTLKAIEGKSPAALSASSDAVYETCETCHGKYLPK